MNEPLLSPSEILVRLYNLIERRAVVGFDVEGEEWMTCCGFATAATPGQPQRAFVIDTLGMRGQPHSKAIWEALRAVLESERVVKVCWNAAHERGFLEWVCGIRLRNYEDCMFRWAERWPELPKRLKYAASILTRLPCWTEGISFSEKDEEAQAKGPALWRYNGTDCIATLQLHLHPQLQLTGGLRQRYLDNLALIEPLNWAAQAGIRYDHEKANQLRAEILPRMWSAQAEVDALAGCPLPRSFIHHARDHLCLKKQKAHVTTLALARVHAKKPHREALDRVREIVSGGRLSGAARGELGGLLGTGCNVKSSGQSSQVIAALKRLGLPLVLKPGKRKPAEGEGGDESAPSASKDQDALLKTFLRTGHPFPVAVLKVMALRGQLQELDRATSERDGRIRASAVIPGSETGRVQYHKWLDGAGGNLGTIPKEPVNFRVLYAADPGEPCSTCGGTGDAPQDETTCSLAFPPLVKCPQCTGRGVVGDHTWWKVDLTGADLWTVAARVASLGDRTMLDDLLAGIRIPSLVGLLMEGYQPPGDRAQVRADCQAYRKRLKESGEGWKDTLWKKASHLTNYGGKPPRIRQGVIEDSYAETGSPVDPGADLCARVQRLYLARYWGLSRWWSDVAGKVMRTGRLEMACGQVREFLSRRPRSGILDDETRREALAAEPQANTTHIVKRAVLASWTDPTNWTSGVVGEGSPTVQVFVLVHDEATGQVPTVALDYARSSLRRWFNQPITIGRETVTMPFDGGFGPNWGECKEPL